MKASDNGRGLEFAVTCLILMVGLLVLLLVADLCGAFSLLDLNP